MSRVYLLIPSPPGRPPRQHLEVEVLLSWLRHRGIEATALDTALSEGPVSPAELLADACRQGARLVYWHVPSATELGELMEPSPAEEGPLQVAGGGYAQAVDDEILAELPQIEAIVRGELELPILGLLQALGEDRPWDRVPATTVRDETRDDGVRRNPPARPGVDLQALPPAADDLFHPSRAQQGQQVLVSRGCNSDCSYCGLQTIYRESFPDSTAFWRSRGPVAVVDEIERCAENHGVRWFHLHAFVTLGYDAAGTAQMEGIADELLRRELGSRLGVRFSFVTHPGHLVRNQALLPKLRDAGLSSLTLGLDSGSQAVLDRFQVPFRLEDSVEALRLLHRHRIPFQPQLIFYEPRTSLEEVGETLAFLRRIHPWFEHLPQPYSLYLCRDLLSRTLWVSRQTPIHRELFEQELWEPPDSPAETGQTFFRDPRVTRFYRGHQAIVQPLLRQVGKRLWDPEACRENPGRALLPLDLLNRWLESVQNAAQGTAQEDLPGTESSESAESAESAVAQELASYLEAQLSKTAIDGSLRVATSRAPKEPLRLEPRRRRTA